MDNSIKIFNITVPITRSELTLRVSGDYHYGLRGVNLNEMVRVLKREQDQHRGNQFVIYPGDLVENNLTTSVGHGYDIEIRDPDKQVEDVKDALIELQKHLYGSDFRKRKKDNVTGCLSAGVIGNHEYRSRNAAGIWLQKQMYGPSKVLDMKVQGLINLTIENKKLKMKKTYRIYVNHRPNNSNATAVERILLQCKRKKADIPADIYVYGHFHRRLIHPDGAYDQDGKFKKVLYVINPSPIMYVEYADWAGFSPLSSAWYTNIRLPIDRDQYAYGKV